MQIEMLNATGILMGGYLSFKKKVLRSASDSSISCPNTIIDRARV